MKKTLSFLLCLVLLVGMAGCAQGQKKTSKSFDTSASNAGFSGDVVAENSHLKIEWDETTKGVFVTDKKSGTKWGTSPIDEGGPQYDELGMPIKKHPKINSVLSVSYLDYETNTVIDTASYTGAIENGRVRCARGKNSLLVEFYFDDPKFMIPVQYILEDDHLRIAINTKDIQEEENKVIKVSVAPFMCSAENDGENRYVFIPSGSGAIIEPVTISQQGTNYSTQVYGYDYTIEKLAEPTQKESVRLPVYGAKMSDGRGMLAIIDSGADSAFIEATVGASVYGYTSAHASFQLRGYTGHIANLFSGLEVENVVYIKDKVEDTLSVSFYPLTGEDASYVGMADTYRKYLKKNGGMPDSCTENALNLTVLGGMMLTDSFLGIPYEKLYAATTLEQVEDMSNDLLKNAKVPFSLILKGFGKTGIDVGTVGGGYTINSKLGSKTKLKELTKQLKKSDIDVFMDFDLVRFKEGSNGFSTFSDACYNAGEKKASQYIYNVAVLDWEEKTMHFMLDPLKIGEASEKLVNTTEKLGLGGVSLESLTSMAYSNYSNKDDTAYYSRSGFAKTVSKSLKQIKKSGVKLAASSANAYSAVLSNIIVNVPTDSDKEHIFSASIPFYEIVFKGHIPMFTESVNLCADKKEMILKAVESGIGLNYTVMDNWSNELIASKHSMLYNSVYSDISDGIINDVNKLSDYYNKIKGAHIISHELLSDTLRLTVFDNGISVYVNYGDEAQVSPAGTVEAESYIVVGGSLS